jgi:hypothetical protein
LYDEQKGAAVSLAASMSCNLKEGLIPRRGGWKKHGTSKNIF